VRQWRSATQFILPSSFWSVTSACGPRPRRRRPVSRKVDRKAEPPWPCLIRTDSAEPIHVHTFIQFRFHSPPLPPNNFGGFFMGRNRSEVRQNQDQPLSSPQPLQRKHWEVDRSISSTLKDQRCRSRASPSIHRPRPLPMRPCPWPCLPVAARASTIIFPAKAWSAIWPAGMCYTAQGVSLALTREIFRQATRA